jgi:hypothetical protein
MVTMAARNMLSKLRGFRILRQLHCRRYGDVIDTQRAFRAGTGKDMPIALAFIA